MNILYLAHRIPYPPDKGDKIRSFHQISHLSKEHTVHLACLIDEKGDVQYVKELQRYCASVGVVYRKQLVKKLLAAHALLTNKPLSVACFYSKELQKQITRCIITEKIDVIFVFSSAMAEYVWRVEHIPKMIDFVDVDSEKWRLYADYHPFPLSWIYRMEAQRLADYERRIVNTFDHSLFISHKEASFLREQACADSISVVSNGVDQNYFSPCGILDQIGSTDLVFIGMMDYFPNIDAVQYFCRDILPHIRASVPQVRFYIVGRNPTAAVKKLACEPHIIVTGSVPDVRPYLTQAAVAVAPFRIARGVQNKVLEAMAMGVPVIGTSLAFQGLGITPQDGVRQADNPAEFAQAVIALLTDPKEHRKCVLRARQYVEKHHQWEEHGSLLNRLIKETAARAA
jgi:sugar transferase (PEP-CTERM/EpsH1 system associated)